MTLFQVGTGQRVRIKAKRIWWVEYGHERQIRENTEYEASTTDKFYTYRGVPRRLMINHTIGWPEFGVWQKDTLDFVEVNGIKK